MKRLALLVALAGLSGCAVSRDVGTALCNAQEQTAEVLVKAGAYVGFFGAGPLAADVVNTGLEFFCTVFDAALSAPAVISEEFGIPVPGSTPNVAADPPGDV